jgi:GR25 family glycosyltransferase involved in LPS biosynthesis
MQDTYLLAITLCILIAFYVYVGWPRAPYISDIHYINLDKDVERRKHMETQLANATMPVHRWPAVNGADLTPDTMARYNVSESVYSHRKNWDGKMRNAGVVGCWLSHVTLLRHLVNKTVPDHAAHLILEDDVTVTPSAFDSSILSNLPADWDIVFFGITKPNIASKITDSLYKLKSYELYGKGNFGTFAYAVRHGSLHTKILPFFTHYLNAVDVQMNQGFDKWNVYAIQPNVIVAESEHQENSSIDKNV